MDGAPMPIETMLLTHDLDTQHRRLLARFPVGFERMELGCYQTRERFLILAGSLHIGRQTFTPGDFVDVGAGVVRDETRAPRGALALVLFDALPRWSAAASSSVAGILPWVHLREPDRFSGHFWG